MLMWKTAQKLAKKKQLNFCAKLQIILTITAIYKKNFNQQLFLLKFWNTEKCLKKTNILPFFIPLLSLFWFSWIKKRQKLKIY